MKGRIRGWMRGTVRIAATGSFCERFLNLCAYHDIRLWELRAVEGGCEASLSLAGFWKLKPLARKCRVHIRVLDKSGLPFALYRCRSRKPLLLALAASFLMIISLSFFIWDIRIEGNLSVTNEVILDYLGEAGIRQGTLKGGTDYKQLAAELRQAFPKLAWVSVRLEGTRLILSFKEQEEGAGLEESGKMACDLAAQEDGVIVNMITRSGTPLVAVGDTVKKGDILVSGCVELRNDADEVYAVQYVAADADVYIKTKIPYEDRIPFKQKQKVYTGEENTRYLLELGSFHLGIPFFGKQEKRYDCISDRKQLRLMENFYLPVYFSEITRREYEIEEKILSYEAVKKQAEQNLQKFLKKIQEKGVQIFQNDVKINKVGSVCQAEGTLSAIKKTGQRVHTDQTQHTGSIPMS